MTPAGFVIYIGTIFIFTETILIQSSAAMIEPFCVNVNTSSVTPEKVSPIIVIVLSVPL